MDLTEPTTEPTTGPFLRRLRSWRRLPLSAQLIFIGLAVGVTWFLTARLAADMVTEKQRAMNDLRDQLHQAEISGARVLTDVMSMAAAHRGHLMTGQPRYLEKYEQARRAFGLDVGGIQAVMSRDPRIRTDSERLIALVAAWDQSVVRALAEGEQDRWRDRRSSARAIDSLILGVAMTDEFRAVHTEMMRSLREDVISLEAESETDAALDEWESFLLRAAAVGMFALLLTMLLRLVSRSLNQVVLAAEALDAGRYADARLPNAHRAPNEEMASLARTFDRLAQSIEQREGQLQDDIEQLKELERLKADFVSTVSHELRTPLTSMRGALGLLLSGAGGELSAKGRDLLRIALTNTDRLIRLINDILDIEKIDAGHVQIRRDRLRLRPLLEATVAGLEGLARDADVHLKISEVADVELFGDGDRLTQVFTNLISNAVKFSPKGAAVELSGELIDGFVRIGVRDHGPGIPPEFASRIFGRFQQAESAAMRRSGGTGLGLSISKAITEMHAGRIGFQSAEGGGTEFYVDLPVAPSPTGELDARPGVLIVEDDESMRAVLSALLEPFARPISVGEADAAWRVLEETRIRVVILDTGLPGMDGLSFARRLRADTRFRTIAVLLYSASDFTPQDLKDSGIRISDAFVKTRDSEASLVNRVRRELQGMTVER